MNLGPAEIGLLLLAVMLLFGYKKLPDASRSLGRSLRIFRGEINSPHEEPAAPPVTPATLELASASRTRPIYDQQTTLDDRRWPTWAHHVNGL